VGGGVNSPLSPASRVRDQRLPAKQVTRATGPEAEVTCMNEASPFLCTVRIPPSLCRVLCVVPCLPVLTFQWARAPRGISPE
jgi:hypothetical protein